MSNGSLNTAPTKSQAGELRDRLMNLEGLPPFPGTASQILAECQKSEVDVRRVARLVECEPAISSKVIQLANSPLFGASRPIASISHAIVLLGFKSVSQLAISIAVGTVFEQGDPNIAKYRKQTFRQSLACAITARMLTNELDSVDPDEAFLCGVMHDIGKLVLFDVVPTEYCELLDRTSSDDTTSDEQAIFGVDHATIGKQCGIKWGLPERVESAIEQHHMNISESTPNLTKTIIAGNYFARQWEMIDSPRIKQPVVPEIESLFEAANLTEIRVECIEQFATAIEICAA